MRNPNYNVRMPFPLPATLRWLDESILELDLVQEPVTETIRGTESALELVTDDKKTDAITSEGATYSQQQSTLEEKKAASGEAKGAQDHWGARLPKQLRRRDLGWSRRTN